MMLRMLKILLVALVAGFALPAAAQQSLVDAKAAGQVGERADGLVGIVSGSPTPALQSLVDQVNAQRLAEYKKVAEQTKAPLEAVQARAGRQLIDRLGAGEYFTDAAGRWRKK